MNAEIIPTIVPAKLSDVREVSEGYSPFASFFQIDVADGVFAPNTTWLPEKGYRLPGEYKYEVHMMVVDPLPLGDIFADAGADTLIAHVEALGTAEDAIQRFATWRQKGVRAVSLAVLFQTPFDVLEPYAQHIDFALLMTIPRIGVQGIPYEESAPKRVAEFHAMHPEVLIAVDGGISTSNIADLARAGARRFGVGSAISRAEDPSAAYEELKTLAGSAL